MYAYAYLHIHKFKLLGLSWEKWYFQVIFLMIFPSWIKRPQSSQQFGKGLDQALETGNFYIWDVKILPFTLH